MVNYDGLQIKINEHFERICDENYNIDLPWTIDGVSQNKYEYLWIYLKDDTLEYYLWPDREILKKRKVKASMPLFDCGLMMLNWKMKYIMELMLIRRLGYAGKILSSCSIGKQKELDMKKHWDRHLLMGTWDGIFRNLASMLPKHMRKALRNSKRRDIFGLFQHLLGLLSFVK